MNAQRLEALMVEGFGERWREKRIVGPVGAVLIRSRGWHLPRPRPRRRRRSRHGGLRERRPLRRGHPILFGVFVCALGGSAMAGDAPVGIVSLIGALWAVGV